MTLYSLVLFFHIAAVLALFAALNVEALSLYRLRRVATLAEAQLWIEPVPGLPLVALASLLVVFFSGIYLTIRMSAFDAAWPKVTVVALLCIAALAAISGRRMRMIRRTCATATAIGSEVRGLLQDSLLPISLGIRSAVVLGIVLLMGAKPELWESVGILGVSAVLGFLGSFLALRSNT